MSGTENVNLDVQTKVHPESEHQSQSGIDSLNQDDFQEEKLTPAQKMDRLLRGTSTDSMKKEIRKLRDEAAKYRKSSRTIAEEKEAIEQKAKEIEEELKNLKESNRTLSIIRKLDNAGCIKSDLVAKDIPHNCEDIDAFIANYKEENGFLFKTPKQNFGTNFKPSSSKNLSASQKMDAYIRAALGR